MYKSSFRACLLVLVLTSPWAVSAAGLGKLTINSALGQPLQAEIDLVAVNNEEISSLAAQLGSHEAFQQAGIDYKPFFSAFDISIEPRPNGDPFIKVTSASAINEPFLNMLVELSWASGRLLREYTVLLDPVESVVPEPVAPVINNNSAAIENRSDKPGASVPPTQQTVTAKTVEKAPVSGNQRGTTYGPVVQGDTLSDIARQISPAGVSLNQVLIATFRANRNAFIEDNINLLKAGEVLRIPNQGEIAAIPEAEANQEVKVHVADWRGYRNRLVVAANESSENEEVIKQSDMGQITATMADEAVESKGEPKEFLRLSSGVPLGDSSSTGGSGNEMPQDRLRMMEEDATARNLALEEANERIAILERNIQDLQRLLELKNPTLAEAQMQAENLLSPESAAPELMADQESERMHDSDSMLESESIAVMADSSEFLSDTVINDSVDPNLIMQTGAAEPFAPSDELIPGEEVSLLDQLMKNITYIGGAVAFLLLGTLAIVRIRRKKAEDELAADEMGIEASMALRERLASVKAADSLATHDGSAADRFGPDNEMADDALDAEQVYEDQHNTEFNAAVDENTDRTSAEIEMDAESDWQQESENSSTQSDDEANIDLGDLAETNQQAAQEDQSDDAEFDLDLDEPASDESVSDNDTAVSDQKDPDLDLNIEDEPVFEKPEIPDLASNEADNMLTLDSPEIDGDVVAEETEKKAEPETVAYETDNAMPFGLDNPAEDTSPEPANLEKTAPDEQSEAMDPAIDYPDVSEHTKQAEADETNEIVSDSDSSADQDKTTDLDLDLDLDPKFDAQSANSNLLSSDSSLSDLKSEMEIPPHESEEITETVAGEKDAHWHEVETKIDLARAYLDMEDKEGAREILEEVINEGDEQQKENAKAMLAAL